MQSVFKLPLAVAALQRVEAGELKLDEPIRFNPGDRIPHTLSPLQDRYPEGNVDVPLHELLRLAVEMSDNAAADIVLRRVGGPGAIQPGAGFQLRDGEATLHRDVQAQYRNWWEPAGAVDFLSKLGNGQMLNPEHTRMVLEWMRDTPRAPGRIKGLLPPGTIAMRKPGTSGVDNGLAHATNDIGLILLPDGRHLAIAVFLTDSTLDDLARDKVVARITRTVWDAARLLK
jgi:beta-lactamase class A